MKTLDTKVGPSLLAGHEEIGGTRVKFKNFEEQLGYLRTMIAEATADMALRELTVSIIIPEAPAKDEYAQALAVGRWVQKNIYYVHEGVETFERPVTTLRLKSGDCDAMTVLILSMLATIGIRGKMCVLRINGRNAHIFPVVFVKDGGKLHRLTLDATLDDPIDDLVNPIAVVKARGDKVQAIFG